MINIDACTLVLCDGNGGWRLGGDEEKRGEGEEEKKADNGGGGGLKWNNEWTGYWAASFYVRHKAFRLRLVRNYIIVFKFCFEVEVGKCEWETRQNDVVLVLIYKIRFGSGVTRPETEPNYSVSVRFFHFRFRFFLGSGFYGSVRIGSVRSVRSVFGLILTALIRKQVPDYKTHAYSTWETERVNQVPNTFLICNLIPKPSN